MKTKKTLKQKIALGFCCADLGLVLTSLGFGIAGTIVKENAHKNFAKSDEYKQAIAEQIEEINEKYIGKENTLENLQLQLEEQQYVFSLENQENLLKASESEYGKQYDKGTTFGAIGVGAGLVGIAGVTATGFFVIDGKNEEKYGKQSQEEKEYEI